MHNKLFSILDSLKGTYKDVNFTVEYDSFDDGDYYYSIYHDSRILDEECSIYEAFYNLVDIHFPNSANIALVYGKSYVPELVIDGLSYS